MPWVPLPPGPTTSQYSSCLLGQKQKQERGLVVFPWRPSARWAAFLKGCLGWGSWWQLSVVPGRWGWHCPRCSSARAKCRAALGAVAHQTFVGFEARQGLAAGDGGQGAAEAQHGGRGVLPWGERAGEAWLTRLCVCGAGDFMDEQ